MSPSLILEDVEQSIGGRFDDVTAANPDRTAIKTPTGEITYLELSRRADGIASALLERAVQARTDARGPVAVLLPQGIDAVAAQLGILKSGGCYVPLDLRHPTALLRDTVKHARARWIVTSTQLAAKATAAIGRADAVIDVRATGAALPAVPHPDRAGPDSLAYIYYTSGSTGRPKGVADTHRNVLHNVLRYTRNLGLRSDDRFTLLQSPAFSGAVSSTYCALLNGAMLCPFDVREDGPDRLADWLVGCGVTVYHSVPSLFRTLAAGRRDYPRLRLIRLEGDRALARDVELFKAHFAPTATLVNGLGTTETGIARQYFVRHDTEVGAGLLPVGYPVPEVEVAVVDASGNRVGDGEVGEIAVKSRYLARGYWQDPRLTAEKFIADPDDADRRIYRTGDLGRMRADGCLEYLGRRDYVVKIRGQSLDPSDIEQAIVADHAVADAAVTARTAATGELELVAFIIPRTWPAPPLERIRAALRGRLPEYMIPSTIVFRDALPLTSFAKVDRNAIAQLARNAVSVPSNGGARAPASLLEQKIAAIWAEVMDRETVPLDAPFLDCGGDSLQAMQILMRVSEGLGVRMEPAQFFELATVRRQAGFLEPLVSAQQEHHAR